MAGPTSGTAATGKSSQRPMALGDGVGWSRSALPLPLFPPLCPLFFLLSPLSPFPSLPPSSSSFSLSFRRRRRFAAGENFLALGRACTTLGAAGRALGGVGWRWVDLEGAGWPEAGVGWTSGSVSGRWVASGRIARRWVRRRRRGREGGVSLTSPPEP